MGLIFRILRWWEEWIWSRGYWIRTTEPKQRVLDQCQTDSMLPGGPVHIILYTSLCTCGSIGYYMGVQNYCLWVKLSL